MVHLVELLESHFKFPKLPVVLLLGLFKHLILHLVVLSPQLIKLIGASRQVWPLASHLNLGIINILNSSHIFGELIQIKLDVGILFHLAL